MTTGEPKRDPSQRFVIVAAVDDSSASSEVARTAADYAWMRPAAEVHLVHVLEPAYDTTAAAVDALALLRDALTAPSGLLSRARREIQATCDARVAAHVAAGQAWREIVQLAVDLEADLIILGTHGRSGVKRWMLGSVAEVVVRKAPCPVFVVRKKAAHVSDVPEMEPPCPDCLAVQRETQGAKLWCAHHAEHRVRPHLHYESPPGFGGGSMLVK